MNFTLQVQNHTKDTKTPRNGGLLGSARRRPTSAMPGQAPAGLASRGRPGQPEVPQAGQVPWPGPRLSQAGPGEPAGPWRVPPGMAQAPDGTPMALSSSPAASAHTEPPWGLHMDRPRQVRSRTDASWRRLTPSWRGGYETATTPRTTPSHPMAIVVPPGMPEAPPDMDTCRPVRPQRRLAPPLHGCPPAQLSYK